MRTWDIVNGMNVIVNNLLVNFTRTGNGPTMLFVHGWADQLSTFDTLIQYFQNDYEIVLLDLPGAGKSQMPQVAWSLDDYAQHVADFTKKIGIKPNVVIGHSNGGAIAIKAIATGMLSTQNLVLLSSAGIRNDKNVRRLLWNLTAKAGKAATIALPTAIKQKMRARLYKSAGSDLTIAPHMEATFKRIVGEDIRENAAQLKIPTLIISGSKDSSTPPSYGRAFHSLIEGSQFALINDAGHFAHQTNTDEVANYMKGFIK